MVTISLSLAAAYFVRFDFLFPRSEMQRLWLGIGIALATKMLIFYLVGIEHGWWRFSGLADLVKIFVANVMASSVFTLVTAIAVGKSFPRSVFLIDFLLCFLSTAGARFGVRLYHEMVLHEVGTKAATNMARGLLIYGAGVSGFHRFTRNQGYARLELPNRRFPRRRSA